VVGGTEPIPSATILIETAAAYTTAAITPVNRDEWKSATKGTR
jgi:hypothetical protein